MKTILIILILIQIKFTWNSIKACFMAEAVTATWQQIGVMTVEFIMLIYVVVSDTIIIVQ